MIFEEELKDLIQKSLQTCFKVKKDSPPIIIEIPKEKKYGEFTSNVAMQLTKVLRKPPFELATQLSEKIKMDLPRGPLKDKIQKVEVVHPGFINFYLSPDARYDLLVHVLKEKENFGRSTFGQKKKVQIEFVSANPTGPLSVAHGRQAAVGDALANIMNFVGFHVTKEFYVNDEGNQINLLGRSIEFRTREILGEEIQFPAEGYQGDYISEMAKIFLEKNKISSVKNLEGKTAAIQQFGVDYLLEVIKKELDDFGVHFDIWSYQSKIATKQNIESVLDFLGEKGFLYEKEGALWFKSTDFGDDKDRVVEKSDGSHTYLTPDIVYHRDKFKRGFDKVINIWGPDHHGYILRLKAAVEALGYEQDDLVVLIVQLATIYRHGQPISMSTRRGQYISLREVMEEVGVDAARFFFLMRRISAHLDFDLELAKKQTPENPVYYIQYAHARVYSIFEKAKETSLSLKNSHFSRLKEVEEFDLLDKIAQFPEILVACTQQYNPFPLVSYLQEVAILFHKFYEKHRVLNEEDKDLSAERLALIEATCIVLANGLRLVGVSAPKKM